MAYNFEKTEHAFKTFNRDLKEDKLSGVLLFYGEEQYLISWAIDSIVKKYINPDSVDFDYIKLNDEETSVSNIIEVSDTFSMFSNRKVVVVNDFVPLKNGNAKGFSDDEKDELISYLESPNEDTTLIFLVDEINDKLGFTKKLMSLSQVYNFCKLDPPELRGFIEKRFNAHNISIDRNLIQLLIDETGYYHKESNYRIFNLENDIKKIVAVSDGKAIKEQDIVSTLCGDLDTFIFNFLKAVSSNQKQQAFELLENILESGNDIFSILALLINNFEILLMVSEFSKERGLNQSQIASQLKIHEFRVKNALAESRVMKTERIKSILSSLYETDRLIKSGDLDQRLAVELLVARI